MHKFIEMDSKDKDEEMEFGECILASKWLESQSMTASLGEDKIIRFLCSHPWINYEVIEMFAKLANFSRCDDF